MRLAKTQISLGIRPVWSESLLCAQWVAKDPSFLHADSEDSDQTGRMPRLICVFAERTCHFVGFVMWRLKCWRCMLTHYSKTWKTAPVGLITCNVLFKLAVVPIFVCTIWILAFANNCFRYMIINWTESPFCVGYELLSFQSEVR